VGEDIQQESFSRAEEQRFVERLQISLEALRRLLERPQFGAGAPSLGAELELVLVDACGRPLPLNRAVLSETVDPRFTVELDRFNLECNLRPTALRGSPFAALRAELCGALDELERAAAVHQGRIVPIGILPTLEPGDLAPSAMTDSPRYRVLSAALRRLRARPFQFRIDGAEPLELDAEDVTFEGAATSLQVHLRVSPEEFSAAYNAAQLASAPVLAYSANSPIFLGRKLWHETRIALFKQAVDDRTAREQRLRVPARVAFGSRWLSGGALELFREANAHDVLLPVLADQDPIAVLDAGGLPHLSELRLHQGTVWTWNRPVYDPADGGHLRIELRMLPAGPSVGDMLANVAFLLGLTHALIPRVPSYVEKMPFEAAEANFYRAAQHGPQALLWWPAEGAATELERVPAQQLVERLLPLAREGLLSMGVCEADFSPWLEIFGQRWASGRTGARWQLETLDRFEASGLERRAALVALLECYLEQAAAGRPVHTWPT